MSFQIYPSRITVVTLDSPKTEVERGKRQKIGRNPFNETIQPN